MTMTTTVVEDGVEGDHRYVVADHDITSLANADSEPFDAAATFDMDVVWGGSVLELENAASYEVVLDQANDIHVHNKDGTDPTSGTDVGVVRIKWEGDPSA